MTSTLWLTLSAFASSDRLVRLGDDGRVACPFGRGDAGVDWCFTCPSFRAICETRAGSTWLRCSAQGQA